MRLIVLFFIGLPGVLFAQDSLRRSASAQVPKLILKTNLTTLINPFKQAAMLTVDVRIAPRISIDAGAGMIFHSATFADQKGESYQGARLRLGAKYFYKSRERNPGYIGFELKHNAVTHRFWRSVLRQGGQYTEIRLNDRSVKTWGAAFRFGVPFFLGEGKRLLIEPYLGIGAVIHDVSMRLPPDAELVGEREWFSVEYPLGKTSSLDMLYGVHIGYVLW